VNRNAKGPFGASAKPPRGPASSRRIGRGLFGAACVCALGLGALAGSGAPSAGAAAQPTVFTWSNTPESGSEVLLRGAVNPENSPLSECRFVYGTDESYGSEAPCESEGPISGAQPVEVSARISGLQPATKYHYALSVDNGTGGPNQSTDALFESLSEPRSEAACPNQNRREDQHSTNLPDCRAYELVSPSDKNGGNVASSATRTRSSLSGDAVGFVSLAGFAQTEGAGIATDYLAERTALPGSQGWATHSLSPRREPLSLPGVVFGKDLVYKAEFSEDLSRALLSTSTPLTDEPNVAQVENLYLREDALDPSAGSYRLLTPCPDCSAPLSDHIGNYRPEFADATPNLSQVLFESTKELTADAPAQSNPLCLFAGVGCGTRLYESDGAETRFLGLIPSAPDVQCGPAPLGPCHAAPNSIAGDGASIDRYTMNTISDDGSRVFFTVGEVGSAKGELYLRQDHTTTVWLNASERTDCADHDPCSGIPEPDPGGSQLAAYQLPSPDGAKVLFTSKEALTDDANVDNSLKLYRYDASLPADNPHNLNLISPAATSVIGASKDDSYVYFFANSALLPGQPELSGARLGVYLWHDGALTLLGRLSEEQPDQLGPDLIWVLNLHGARVSADGGTLLFTARSGQGLIGYDQESACPTDEVCTELYLYRAAIHALSCVSCPLDGAAATAAARITETASGRLGQEQSGLGASTPATHINRAVSADGNHIFFESGQGLLPSDTNDASDVYEYDVPSATLHLISSGTSPAGSHFLEISPDGANVFFTTGQRLSAWDSDGAVDLYDARVDGGFPEPAPEPAPCAGTEQCRSSSSPPPASAAASATFTGPADPVRKKHHRGRRQKKHRIHHHRTSQSRGKRR
jgi:hypothetical protein